MNTIRQYEIRSSLYHHYIYKDVIHINEIQWHRSLLEKKKDNPHIYLKANIQVCVQH